MTSLARTIAGLACTLTMAVLAIVLACPDTTPAALGALSQRILIGPSGIALASLVMIYGVGNGVSGGSPMPMISGCGLAALIAWGSPYVLLLNSPEAMGLYGLLIVSSIVWLLAGVWPERTLGTLPASLKYFGTMAFVVLTVPLWGSTRVRAWAQSKWPF